MLRPTGIENNLERLINRYCKMSTIKLINKYQAGGETRRTPSTLEYFIPIYGTYLSGRDFAEDPTWKNGLTLGLSALGDVATIVGAGALLKGLGPAAKVTSKGSKLGKSAFKAYQTSQAKYTKALEAYRATPNPTTKAYLDEAFGALKYAETQVAKATGAVGNLSEAGQKAVRAQQYVGRFKPNRTVTDVVPH